MWNLLGGYVVGAIVAGVVLHTVDRNSRDRITSALVAKL